jgi:hypothetical protein
LGLLAFTGSLRFGCAPVPQLGLPVFIGPQPSQAPVATALHATPTPPRPPGPVASLSSLLNQQTCTGPPSPLLVSSSLNQHMSRLFIRLNSKPGEAISSTRCCRHVDSSFRPAAPTSANSLDPLSSAVTPDDSLPLSFSFYRIGGIALDSTLCCLPPHQMTLYITSRPISSSAVIPDDTIPCPWILFSIHRPFPYVPNSVMPTLYVTLDSPRRCLLSASMDFIMPSCRV